MQMAEQTPCSFCYILDRSDGRSKKPVLYRGENAAGVSATVTSIDSIQPLLFAVADMIYTPEDCQSFCEATRHHKCWKGLGKCKIRDHCHVFDKYRGAANNDCNLKICISHDKCKTPVVFHNLRPTTATS